MRCCCDADLCCAVLLCCAVVILPCVCVVARWISRSCVVVVWVAVGYSACCWDWNQVCRAAHTRTQTQRQACHQATQTRAPQPREEQHKARTYAVDAPTTANATVPMLLCLLLASHARHADLEYVKVKALRLTPMSTR